MFLDVLVLLHCILLSRDFIEGRVGLAKNIICIIQLQQIVNLMEMIHEIIAGLNLQ